MKKYIFSAILIFEASIFNSCSDDITSNSDNPKITETEEYSPQGNPGVQEDIKLIVSGAKASSYQPGNGIELSYDGKYDTFYHSNWSNPVDYPTTLEYNFDNTPTIDYLVYHPRKNDVRGNFKEFEVWISTETEPLFKKVGVYDFKGVATASRINFPNGLRKVKAVRFVVNSAINEIPGYKKPGITSCGEMEFFVKGRSSYNPLNIFTDMTCSELKTGFEQKNVDSISNAFYKNIAQHMLRGSYPREYRIQEYKPYPYPTIMAAECKMSPYSLRDNPTGISVSEGEEMTVMVGPNTQNISLLIQDLDNGYGGSVYQLSEGVNVFKAANKGLAYIMYYTPTGTEKPVKIHIATGKVNGVFRSDKHTAKDWVNILNKTTDKYLDVVGAYAHLTFPVESFKKYTSDGLRLIQAYDSIVKFEQRFLGLEKYKRVIKNHLYCHVVYTDSYMYATDYRTAYSEPTMAKILDPNKLTGGDIWGPAHEMGHIHQTRPGFKWAGMTEVSNNVLSLYVQKCFGNKARLENADDKRYNSIYEQSLHEIVVPHIAHGAAGDNAFFQKLVPFWQLQLYCAGVKGKNDFYKDIYEAIRVNVDPSTSGKCQLAFVKLCCEMAGEDLTDFFQTWGLLKPVQLTINDYGNKDMTITQEEVETTLAEIKALGLTKPVAPFQYICESNYDLFKLNNAVSKGTVTINGTKVTMNGWKNAVAFEVFSNNSLVFVSPYSTFDLQNNYSNLKIYAVAANGTRTEATL